MNRHYTADEYRQLCKKLRATFDDATITTDIMVGFNDETEEDFNASLQFAKEIGFEKVHTFPYSERQGTVASRKGDNVPKQEKERRASVMIEETNKIRHEYFNKLIGAKEVVLFENNIGGNAYQGYTKNYVPVRMESDTDIIGKEIEVTIKSADINLDCCFA